MIDTLQLGIPLTERQYNKLFSLGACSDIWQPSQTNLFTGDIKLWRVSGTFEAPEPSYHRKIAWSVPPTYDPADACCLKVELSLPKYWWGHNIRLLHDWLGALRELKRDLERSLKCRFSPVEDWKVWRVDFCYAWNLHSEDNAYAFLESVKRLTYPRQKKTTHKESVQFIGRTYSSKFYLKYPEFRTHDLKVLVKNGVSIEHIESLENMARGVLRFEVTARKQWLQVAHQIYTIGDLARKVLGMELVGDWPDGDLEIMHRVNIILAEHFKRIGESPITSGTVLREPICESYVIDQGGEPDEVLGIQNMPILYADYLSSIYTVCQPGQVPSSWPDDCSLSEDEEDQGLSVWRYLCDGTRSIVFCEYDRPTEILNQVLTRFIGVHRGMNTEEQVLGKLCDRYKKNTAANLHGFWLFVKTHGSERAREFFGKDAFNYKRRQLREAGVSLVEAPKASLRSDAELLRNFRLEVPSPYVVNAFDDARNMENLLNRLPDRVLGNRVLGKITRRRYTPLAISVED